MQREWPSNTTWKNFELLLPIFKETASQPEIVTISKYFKAIRTGTVSLTTLLQKADRLPKDDDIIIEETEEEQKLIERNEKKTTGKTLTAMMMKKIMKKVRMTAKKRKKPKKENVNLLLLLRQ
jgi:hypothetical protein